MEEDSTFMLTGSQGLWKADWENIETATRRDGGRPYDVVTVDVWRDPVAPRPDAPAGCTVCSNGRSVVTLKHASCGVTLFELRVHAIDWVAVDGDGRRRRISEPMPFRDPRKRRTLHFKSQVGRMMEGYGMTVSKCASACHTTPAIVKEVNKGRLSALAGDMRPLHPSRAIAVDEFLIAHGYRYCTVILDADTGELLYLERGKGKDQVLHFFTWAGDDFMRGVEAVSMDMNANYAAAFQERWPHVEVVYDGFHIIKWFNERVVDSLRKSEAKKLRKRADALREAGDAVAAAEVEAERSLLYGARFNLLANERTLRAKDALNAELNAQARADAASCGRDPAEAGHRREGNAEARRALLDANASLQCAVRAREELQDILKGECAPTMRMALRAWCDLYSKAGIAQLTRFTATILRKMEGIVSRAVHRISSGVVEGTNTLIKNMRRQAFGLVDFDYFGLLLWEMTHLPNRRRREGARRPYHRSRKWNKRNMQQTIYRWDLEKAAAG